jgi:PPOX class probable F420-dependent enzyme
VNEPQAGRPEMPGYGIAEGPEGALPWSWAEQRLANSRNYFIGTTRPDGRPHAMPVWAVWLSGILWFSTARTSVKARNLAANPHVTVCTDRAEEAVILEGRAQIEDDQTALEPVWAAYYAKYDWDVSGESLFAVHPHKVFAFIESPDEFEQSATRWIFTEAP